MRGLLIVLSLTLSLGISAGDIERGIVARLNGGCREREPAIGEEHLLTDVERISLQSISELSKETAYVAALMVKYQVGPNAVIDRERGTIKPLGKCMAWAKDERRPEPFRKQLIKRTPR
jgi:hypothetical protein